MNKIMQLIKDNFNLAKPPVNLVKNENEASIYIYDVIDAWWGVSALSVVDAVEKAEGAEVLHVYINSPGGSVFEGRAMMAAIQRFEGTTIAHIDSLCASAATSVALACDQVEMADGAFFMIHNASTLAWGDKTVMRDTADILEKIETAIVDDYTSKTDKPKDEIVAWMDAETWFTAQEALDNGFVDAVKPRPSADKADNLANKQAWNLAAYEKAPAALLNVQQADLLQDTVADLIEEPAPAGFLMSAANANRLKLIQAL